MFGFPDIAVGGAVSLKTKKCFKVSFENLCSTATSTDFATGSGAGILYQWFNLNFVIRIIKSSRLVHFFKPSNCNPMKLDDSLIWSLGCCLKFVSYVNKNAIYELDYQVSTVTQSLGFDMKVFWHVEHAVEHPIQNETKTWIWKKMG